MKKISFLLALFVFSLVVAGCTLLFGEKSINSKSSTTTDAEDITEGNKMTDDSALDNNQPIFTGTVLAGSVSPLLDFNQADYQKALSSGKIVVLYFYANWCPICRVEFPKMQQAFNQLSTDQVIGFRVNYKDTETDDNEKNLAREFGVAYQHTKVILENGRQVLKAPDSWEEKRYLDEINKLSN